jgi:hypothetical protein
MSGVGRFQNDVVERTDPVSFALDFVAALRERKDLSQVPSLRTAVAIPRFLTARYFRKGALNARDYVEAAVYLTPYEDQGAALEVARELLFPKQKPATVAVAVAEAATPTSEAPRPEASILDDLAGLDLGDLGALDLAALDRALDQRTAAAVELKAFDCWAALSTSEDPQEQGLASLVSLFGGPAELEAEGARARDSVLRFILERLRGRMGALSPEEAFQASRAGLTGSLLEEAPQRWERAGLLGGQGRSAVAPLLEEVLKDGVAHELGRMIAFLAPHAKQLGATYTGFRSKALSSARHLSDWAEMLEGLGGFEPPPRELLEGSARENLPRALAAADALERAFSSSSVSMKPTVFEAWADALVAPPTLDFLLDCCVPCARWDALVEAAFAREAVPAFLAAAALQADERAEQVRGLLPLGRRLRDTNTDPGKRLAGELSTLALVTLRDARRFLPLLDALLDARLIPSDNAQVVAAGAALGIAEEEIWARLSAPLEQLRYLIEAKVCDAQRYADLVGKLVEIPEEVLAQLVERCLADRNLMGLALLLAVALGPVCAQLPQDLAIQCLGYKGIGGGENLLLQWYVHRDQAHGELRERIKAIARQALLDAALVWVHRGAGGAAQGLVPQSRARPWRAGDDLDDLDVEATLDSLVGAGKALDALSDEDLRVAETTSGRAGFGVLIDISGSMSERDLAVCAIAVVMLLGRLRPEEVAIALFESNTVALKHFATERELEDVADELLELRATGGTCVDRALRFIADEFESEPEHERRVLFLLSDFCFFEEARELVPLLHRLRELNVGYLGASHGRANSRACALFLQELGGHGVKLSSLKKLPEVLLEALVAVAGP